MGDYQDFCEAYGGSANDPDFMDNWLNEHVNEGKHLKIQNHNSNSSVLKSKYKLSNNEWTQVKEYVAIYIKYSFKEHYEVNNYISKHNLWYNFTDIRSLNEHGSHKNIPGIMPNFYAAVCEILEITGANGSPLTKAERY